MLHRYAKENLPNKSSHECGWSQKRQKCRQQKITMSCKGHLNGTMDMLQARKRIGITSIGNNQKFTVKKD